MDLFDIIYNKSSSVSHTLFAWRFCYCRIITKVLLFLLLLAAFPHSLLSSMSPYNSTNTRRTCVFPGWVHFGIFGLFHYFRSFSASWWWTISISPFWIVRSCSCWTNMRLTIPCLKNIFKIHIVTQSLPKISKPGFEEGLGCDISTEKWTALD